MANCLLASNNYKDSKNKDSKNYKMKILAIETAHGICSVAVSDNGVLIAEKTDLESSRQAERLLPTISQLLKETNLSYSDINAVAVDIGPGSFTGVRIGLAASHGIAMAAKIPLIGVTGFEAITHQARMSELYENMLVVFDARRGQVFAQLFHKNEPKDPLMLEYKDIISLSGLHQHITIVGDGAEMVEPFMQVGKINYSIIEDFLLPSADMVALAAFDKLSSGNFSINPAPLYIRPPDAKLPGGLVPSSYSQ